MLNFLLKTRQNDCALYTRMGNGTESTYAYGGQCERLKDMHFLSRIGAVFSNSVTIFYSINCLSKKVLLPLPP